MKSALNSIRIVIDTNIFISAIVFGGQPRKVLNLLADDSITVVMAEEILTEIKRIITAKFPSFISDLKKIEKLLETDADWVRLGSVSINVCRDPDDDKFIEAAMLGRCQYIVSGDNDLLALLSYKTIKIVSATEFLNLAK